MAEPRPAVSTVDSAEVGRASKVSAKVVIGVTLALLGGPVLVDLAVSGRSRPFGYAAPDAFYYLTIARSIARHGLPAFDGEHATNGFHPLWQLLLGLLTFLTEHLGIGQYTLLAAVIVGLALTAGGVFLLGAVLAERRRLTPAFAALPVGVYAFLLAPFYLPRLQQFAATSAEGTIPVYGTLWSYANGMESGAVLASFGLAAWTWRAFMRARTLGRAAAFGLSLAALTLSRLDHVLIALPMGVSFYLSARALARQREGLAGLAAFAVPVGAYALGNQLRFGSFMPVSGAMKTSFPLPTSVHIQNLLDVWRQGAAYDIWKLVCESFVLVPAVFALVYLGCTLRPTLLGSTLVVHYRASARAYERFLVPVAFGVLLLALYNGGFVFDGPSHWYMPVSTTFVSLAVIALLARSPRPLGTLAQGGTLLAVGIASLVFFVELHRHLDYHARFADFFWRDAPPLRALFGEHPPRLLEFDDGIVSYALDVPAMSAGLALDPEGADARKAGRLYTLAYERGFNCVSSLYYGNAGELARDRSPDACRRYVQQWETQDIEPYQFELAYLTPSASLAIVCGKKP